LTENAFLVYYAVCLQESHFCSNNATIKKEKTMSQQHMKARKRARRKQYIERVKARIAEKIAAKKK